MNRRSFLRLGSGPSGPAGQSGQPGPSGPAQQADPLYDPSVVQEHAPVTALDNDAGIKALEHRLKCTCGCNLDIYTCRTTDFTCTYSPALHQEVLALRRAGRNDEQIVDAFVAKYGESILMAPKPVGFNLAGYLVPSIVIALVALALAWVLVRRSRRMATPDAASAARSPAAGSVDHDRLRRALADVED